MSIDTLKQTVNLDARMINFLRTDSGFDGIRDSSEFQDFIKFKLHEINGIVHRSYYALKPQNN